MHVQDWKLTANLSAAGIPAVALDPSTDATYVAFVDVAHSDMAKIIALNTTTSAFIGPAGFQLLEGNMGRHAP